MLCSHICILHVCAYANKHIYRPAVLPRQTSPSNALPSLHTMIFSLVNLLCSKNLQISIDTWEITLLCINTYFTMKLQNWDLYHAKKVLFKKFAIVSTVLFNSFINFEWFITDTSELAKSILRSIYLVDQISHEICPWKLLKKSQF